MIKLMKYLKKSAGYVVLIIALLFLQAYCDLSLPDYTSKIVNVGIQQSGIEDSVPEKIRKTSMDNLKLFMDEEDKETIDSYYEEDGDNLVLKDDVKSEEREKLNDILAKPMMIAASFLSGSDGDACQDGSSGRNRSDAGNRTDARGSTRVNDW